jgi:ATP/maltotriose-dependent transcriptional regulator MalT
VPLRDSGDSAALAVLGVIAVETGNGWAELDAYMADMLRDGVRVHDHDAAGLAAFTLARLQFLRGRHHDAARWVAEAEVHLLRQDPFGLIVHLRALEVGIACFTRDLAAADAALARLRSTLEGRRPPPRQLVHVRRAEGWALRLRGDAEAGRRLLEDAAAFAELPGLAASLAYEALRAGASAGPALQAFAARCESRMVRAYALHADARAARDGTALVAAADEFAAIGALRYAVEASSEAARAFVAEGREDSARRAAHRAQDLHPDGQGGERPRIDGLDSTAIALTAREAQLVELASDGLSNAEIADRLVLSVRTVETHLYRAMQKLGVSDRREL